MGFGGGEGGFGSGFGGGFEWGGGFRARVLKTAGSATGRVENHVTEL